MSRIAIYHRTAARCRASVMQICYIHLERTRVRRATSSLHVACLVHAARYLRNRFWDRYDWRIRMRRTFGTRAQRRRSGHPSLPPSVACTFVAERDLCASAASRCDGVRMCVCVCVPVRVFFQSRAISRRSGGAPHQRPTARFARTNGVALIWCWRLHTNVIKCKCSPAPTPTNGSCMFVHDVCGLRTLPI